jgi:hypothetical protein
MEESSMATVATEQLIGWRFPRSDDGPTIGLNEAGVETFSGNILSSLAREPIQNSCDAARGSGPVKVVFQQFELETTRFPGRDAFLDVLKRCKEFWRGVGDGTETFFDDAIEVLSQPTITFVKISDFNTTGLRGSKEARFSDWANLVKANFVSTKNGNAGGSFGIGKNAPFACSKLRTVFYSTLDVDGVSAFQGVSKLATFSDESGNETQGIGYYGRIQGNMPIHDLDEVDDVFRREEIGTDIFIPGFIPTDDWKTGIIQAVLENFFVALHNGQLIVQVDDVVIDSGSLHQLMKKYVEPEKHLSADKYYEALIAQDAKVFVDDIEGLGEVELRVVTGNGLPKRVAMMRSTGMTITCRRFSSPIPFAGVMVVRGAALNQLLRKMENPQHNAWEPDRYQDDPRYASRVLKRLIQWVKEQLQSLWAVDSGDTIEVDDLSQYLPDESDLTLDGANGVEGGERAAPKPVTINKMSTSRRTTITTAGEEAASTDDNDEDSIGGTPYPGQGSPNNVHGGRRRGEQGGGSRNPGRDANQPGTGDKATHGLGKPPKIKRKRIFCTNPSTGEYKLTVYTESDGTGLLQLEIVGEIGEEPATVSFAKDIKTGRSLRVTPAGRIGPVSFLASEPLEVQFKLSEPLRCSMEVQILED